MRIPATRGGRPLSSTIPRGIQSLRGGAVGTLDVASGAAVWPALAAIERTAKEWRRLPLDERLAVAARAGRLLCEATLEVGDTPLGPRQSVSLVSETTGLPARVVRTGLEAIGADLQRANEILRAASPTGECDVYGDPALVRPERITHWVPVGDALAVIAPGNVVGVHAMWALLAIAGFPIALKPSFTDPITPARVIAAFVEAGAPTALFSFLPLEQTDAPILSRAATVSLAFGDDETLRRFPGLTRAFGPGRSVAIVSDVMLLDDTTRSHIRQSILDDAGRACANCSTLVVIGEGSDGLRRLAAELDAVAPRLLDDPAAVLGALPQPVATAWRERLETVADEGAIVHCPCTRSERWLSRTDGLTYLLPALLEIPNDAPAREWEVPGPVVWVVRWPDTVIREGMAALPDARRFAALVAALFIESPALFESLCAHPRVGKVVIGRPTTDVDLAAPHDGTLTQHLYRAKAVLHG